MTEEVSVSEELHVDLRSVPEDERIPQRRYNRVLLKLSGEVFGGGRIGVDPDVVRDIAAQIATAAHTGVQIAVVVGGGNFFRGAELQKSGWTAPAPTTWACSAR